RGIRTDTGFFWFRPPDRPLVLLCPGMEHPHRRQSEIPTAGGWFVCSHGEDPPSLRGGVGVSDGIGSTKKEPGRREIIPPRRDMCMPVMCTARGMPPPSYQKILYFPAVSSQPCRHWDLS